MSYSPYQPVTMILEHRNKLPTSRQQLDPLPPLQDNKVYVTCAAGYESVDDIRLVESECKAGYSWFWTCHVWVLLKIKHMSTLVFVTMFLFCKLYCINMWTCTLPTGWWRVGWLIYYDVIKLGLRSSAKKDPTIRNWGNYNWLVVWLPFSIFPYIGNNNPNWLIFFRGVETTNQTM